MFLLRALFFMCSFCLFIYAQDIQTEQTNANSDTLLEKLKEDLDKAKGTLDGLNESFAETKTTVDKLSKIKISGYIQFQYRMATNYKEATDTTGTGASPLGKTNPVGKYLYPVGDFAGGKFGDGIGSMLQIRRARIKVAYESKLTTGVVQLDCLPFTMSNAVNSVTQAQDTSKKVSTTQTSFLSGGGITLKDAYFRFTDPWIETISLKAGYFDRPFGFEIGYSSSNRESPERSRLFQTLFPLERDLGLSLELVPSGRMPEWLSLFNFKGGAFTGNGINVETDDYLDYIGRFGFSVMSQHLQIGLDGGVSGYFGKVKNYNDTTYFFNADKKIFEPSTGYKYQGINRKYYGLDLQFYASLPFLGGFTLRGEGISGYQPCFSANNSSPKSNVTSSSPVYLRNILGYYLMWVQNIDAINSQFVLKYDSFDPNTLIHGNDIDSAHVKLQKVSPADLMFNTLGLGWVYHWNENVKIMAYYEMVNNEKVAPDMIKNKDFFVYTNPIKANVFTLRIQYKF
jgi:hypothetical protein